MKNLKSIAFAVLLIAGTGEYLTAQKLPVLTQALPTSPTSGPMAVALHLLQKLYMAAP